MFKKFKDKLAEEMKQSPARLQASMQQLAQAVVSPSLSNNSIQDLSFKDSFSLTEETDETPKNSPTKHGFQTVDLTPSSINSSTSRRSSVSSNISDASLLFPIYESSSNVYHLQSDIDQSASEIDDNIGSQLDRYSKEQLYSALRKAQSKCDKYRGRFTDLVNHCRDIDHSKTKLESLLVETQDKTFRRINDLKEQCQLEQQAKAHLEDALRNDIEEKDHVINSLKIKIKLLQEKGPNAENLETTELLENEDNNKVDILVDLSTNTDSQKSSEESALSIENVQLKEKIQKMDTFLEKYKEMLKRNKDKILEVTNEKNTLERDYDILQKTNQEKLDTMEEELRKSKEEFMKLKEEIEVLKKREEESVISLAENKLSIHRELEGKEEQIKQLQLELKQNHDVEKSLNDTIEQQKHELEKVKLVANQNAEASQEHLRGKSEALKHMQSEMQQKLSNLEEKLTLKYQEEVNKNNELLIKLQELEQQPKVTNENTATIEKLTQAIEEKNNLYVDLDNEKENYKRLLDEQKIENARLIKELNELSSTLERIQSEADCSDEKRINEITQNFSDVTAECNKLHAQVKNYVEELENYKNILQTLNEETIGLRNKSKNDSETILKLQDECERKNTEILERTKEIDSSSEVTAELKKEIDSLVNCKNNLIKNLETCRIDFKGIRQDYELLKKYVNNNISNGKGAIVETVRETSKILSFFNDKDSSLNLQVRELLEKNKIVESLNSKYNFNIEQLEEILKKNVALETELKEKYGEVEEMRMKVNALGELEERNRTLELDIENLDRELKNSKGMFDEREQSQQNVIIEKESIIRSMSLAKKEEDERMSEALRLKVSENESANKQLVDLSKACGELEDTIRNLKTENEEQKKAIEELGFVKLQLEERSKELKALQRESDESKAESMKLNDEYENCKKIIETYSTKLTSLGKEANRHKDANKILINELRKSKDLMENVMDNENIEAELKEEILKFKAAENDLNQSANIETDQVKELKRHNAELLTEINDLKESDRNTLDSLLKENAEVRERLGCLEKENGQLANENAANLNLIKSYEHQSRDRSIEIEELRAEKSELNEVRRKITELRGLLSDCQNARLTDDERVDEEPGGGRSLILEIDNLHEEILKLSRSCESSLALENELVDCKNKIRALEGSLSSKDGELTVISNNSWEGKDDFEIELKEKNAQIEEREIKNVQLLEKIDELSLLKLEAEENSAEEIKSLNKVVNRLQETLEGKESKLRLFRIENEKLKRHMKDLLEKIMRERNELQSDMDENNIAYQVKERQIETLNDKMKNQAIELREQMKTNEDKHSLRLKQVVKEFQAQLNDKERELQAALEKRFDQQQNYESSVILEYKEQLKDFQIELTKKSEEIEKLVSENKQMKIRSDEVVEECLADVSRMKSEHTEEIENLDKKWRAIVKQRASQLELKHDDEIAELSNEWQNERKNDENTELLQKDLENTAKVAMAAMQSSSGSFHALQQTLLSQKRELAELRKLVKLRQESVDDSTEIEYLRNILYKYMMGKETMVLAKVIAAVVKFDQDQTTQILKKEEDKLSLLGSLGLT